MKKNISFKLIFVFVFLILSFGILGEETASKPVAVSPGSETESSIVYQSCPTFSWSAVNGAASYRIAIFKVDDEKVSSYKELAARVSPLVVTDIPGRAFSWTLPAEKSLKTGNSYTWYVQAIDATGNSIGQWSNGKIFKVEEEVRYVGFEEKIGEKLKEHGVSEEAIKDIMADMKSDVKEVVVRNSGSQKTTQKDTGLIQGTELAWDTFYGYCAGSHNTTGYNNTFVGSYSGFSNTTGNYNSFFGMHSGNMNTGGYNNNFFGYAAGYANTTGSNNTLVGFSAGHSNTCGYLNTFVGNYTGQFNSTGYRNTFLGSGAGYLNSTGNENTFIGSEAGCNNTTGSGNNFIGNYAGAVNTGTANNFLGNYAGYSNKTGYQNCFFGSNAGRLNTTGYNNAFIGFNAGYNNTTGTDNNFMGYVAGYNNTTGSWNNFLGNYAGASNTTGGTNVFIGHAAGAANTCGYSNSFVGANAGLKNTGYQNCFLGSDAGRMNPAGYGNTFIGTGAGYNSKGSGNVFLGSQAGSNETGSNKLYIANTSTLSPLIFGDFSSCLVRINGKLGIGIFPKYPLHLSSGAYCSAGGIWVNASSRSLKENIRDLSTVEALDAFKQLNPVKFNYKVDQTVQHVGFIAEDAPALLATADRKGLSPMDITAVLTKVVQKLQNDNETYRKTIANQQQLISDLQERMARIEKK